MRVPDPHSSYRWLLVPLAFLAIAAAMLWPLPLRLTSALPGDPTGDTGVYIWNLWIFRHEFLDHGRLPLSTEHIFAYSGNADFSLHNYTPIAGMLGLPLMPWLGVVGTFNVVLMLLVAASGWSAAILGRRLGLSPLAAFAAGALFIASPTITAREAAHLSLASAAALPLFLWALLRVLESHDRRDAVLVGIMVAFASYSDAYFGIYCVLMGLFTLAWRYVEVTPTPRTTDDTLARALRRGQAALACATLVAATLVWLGIDRVLVGGAEVRIGLHGPVLLLTLVSLARLWAKWRPELRLHDPTHELPRLVPLGLLSVGVCTVLMLPPLLGIIDRYLTGRLPETAILWRSSPRGVDLLAYLNPNPLNPLFGSVTGRWFLPPQEDAFPEYVAAFSLVALAAMGWALRHRALPRFWVAFTLLFGSLSLGPFLHIGGINTLVPGPWALLRYVPIIGMARAPTRFAIVAVLGASVLFGFAVDWLRERHSRGVLLALVLLMAVELNPVPRPVFAASVPGVYDLIATGDEAAAVLELPTGVRDGTSSLGDFNASTQFFQTRHHRRLVGGYLSRVSDWRKREMLGSPMLRILMSLSAAGASVDQGDLARAAADRDHFLARTCVGYVVVNRRRAPPGLRDAAVDLLRLESLQQDADYELLRPIDAPACGPRLDAPARFRMRRSRSLPQ